jgi:hypothetical protein
MQITSRKQQQLADKVHLSGAEMKEKLTHELPIF